MNVNRKSRLALSFVASQLLLFTSAACSFGAGPLRVHPENPRYFTDDSGRAILLTGFHTWNSLVDMGPSDPPAAFDYDTYLDWMVEHKQNFFRLWAWELLTWDTSGTRAENPVRHVVSPHPWERTGPGQALDGKPKFDLTKPNAEYFERLRRRVESAQQHGLYPAVMLFEGWGLQFSPDAWANHPFNKANNVNGIDGDLNGDGRGLEIHTGHGRQITQLQRDYVRKVINTVNRFDNVLYEISNENHPASTEWQYDMIRFIKKVEADKPQQHPVGMTFQYKGGTNKTLMESPADWVSPNRDGGYRDNPPAADGSKVIVSDTDHLWGIGGNPAWAWKSFLRGLNPIFMDPYDSRVVNFGFGEEQCKAIRTALMHIAIWGQRVNLAAMKPRPDLASTKFCLARPGVEYLVYVPGDGKKVTVTLPKGSYSLLWFDTTTGRERSNKIVAHAGGKHSMTSPVDRDSLLYIRVTR